MLLALRFCAGLGTGSIVVLTMSVIARTSHPDRYTSFFIACQVFCQSIAFTVLGGLVAEQGINLLYYVFAGLAAIVTPLILFIPHSAATEAQETGRAGDQH